MIFVTAFFVTAVIFETDRQIKKMRPQALIEKQETSASSKQLFIDTWRLIKTKYYEGESTLFKFESALLGSGDVVDADGRVGSRYGELAVQLDFFTGLFWFLFVDEW